MFVCLSIIVVLCVLGGAVFVVSDIQIERQDKNLQQSTISDESIIEKSRIEYNKSIFAISESKVVTNIESNFPTIRVVGIERKFPNKIVIKLTERVPLVALKFKDKPEYLIIDNNMCVIDNVKEKDERLEKLTIVDGYELSSVNNVSYGKQLPASLGQEVVVINHIMAGLQQKMDVTQINDLVKGVHFIKKSNVVYVSTKYGDKGLVIKIDYTEMKDNKELVFNHIQLAYDAYVKLDTEQKQSGYLIYDEKYKTYKYSVRI